ncbi:MAG: heme-binding domain-containing protein [Pyrinomonadaceae bacterium]
MKKIVKVFCVAILAGLVVIQFFGIDKTNPPVVQGETLESAVSVSPDASQIMVRSCNDCHTNTTIFPWYTYVQPVGWFMKNHIDDGRRKLNFSVFNTYPVKKKAKKLEEICEQVESKEMPLPSYLWIHRPAVLSESEAKALCDWAKQEKDKIVVE